MKCTGRVTIRPSNEWGDQYNSHRQSVPQYVAHRSETHSILSRATPMLYVWRRKGGLEACYDMQITGRIVAQSRLMGKGEERHGNLAPPK
jgi:hypothetical protein